MAPSCRGRVNCHQMRASGKPRRKAVRQTRSRSEESEVRPRPDMHQLYTFAPRGRPTCWSGSVRNLEILADPAETVAAQAISTRPTFPCSSANTRLQSGRELRKPVEWLIAAIRATTIEQQGSTLRRPSWLRDPTIRSGRKAD